MEFTECKGFVSMSIVKMSVEPVEHWNNSDFVGFIMRSIIDLRGDPTFKFPNVAWLMYGVHVKRFRKRVEITNVEYKAFIDWVFSDDFLRGRRAVSFLAVVTIDVYYLYVRLQQRANPHVVQQMTADDSEVRHQRLFDTKAIFPEG